MTKTQVIETLDQLPEEFNLEELLDKLILIDKIQEAEKDIAEGRVYTLNEVRTFFMDKWPK
ncbi:MAG: hypothetical protein HC880_16435 [Bacteroidia bacterium]|nr:hypothetical protein [Bacteroidia bacterium]